MATSSLIKIRTFGRLRELAHNAEQTMEVTPGDTVRDVLIRLFAAEPAIADVVSVEDAGTAFAIAMDREYVSPDQAVQAGCEIALIPPVSGG